MQFNLLTDSWLPVRCLSGRTYTIAAHEINRDIDTDPVVAFAAPRPDFNASLMEMMIGWLQVAWLLNMRDNEEWHELFETPPSTEILKQWFALLSPAFELHTEQGGFLQDRDPLTAQKSLPITALLIDAQGSETHWIKDLPTQGVSPAMAALMLYTLQNNAPSGGVGHRTSLRGGGPLTTVVLCKPAIEYAQQQPFPLWKSLWLNVLYPDKFPSEKQAHPSALEQIFPWLTDTPINDKKGKNIRPEDVSKLQQFWGMPRRIRLDFDNLTSGICALSGESCTQLIRQYRTKNYGTNYIDAWQHTLSPHSVSIEPKQIVPLHPNGTVNYRHWLGVIKPTTTGKKKIEPAMIVSEFKKRNIKAQHKLDYLIWAFGYDMDNMKPRCWYEATMPLFHFENPKDREWLEQAAEKMITAANEFVGNLRSCLKAAWFRKDEPRQKSANTGVIETAFWHDTESQFYALLHQIATAPKDEEFRDERFRKWHRFLCRYTEGEFDHWANTQQITQQTYPKRIAQARRDLLSFNWKKAIKNALELPDTRKETA